MAESLWKKGPVRIWSRRLRDAIGLMLRLASSDLETIFQRTIPKETCDQIREADRQLRCMDERKVVPLLGGNVVGEIERALMIGPISRTRRGWTPIISPVRSGRNGGGMDVTMNCEVEFLPVGDGSKPGDSIVVRYGEANAWELLVIDGNLDSGKAQVSHIKSNFGYDAVVAHALVTHSDGDHASGMREVLDGLPVKNLWLDIPWQFAAAARPYFANKNWTDQGLAQELRREYDILGDLVATAVKKNITIQQTFAGMTIGPFHVVSPWQNVYPYFIPQFDRTPDAQAALEAAGFWIGKPLVCWPACSKRRLARSRNGSPRPGRTSV